MIPLPSLPKITKKEKNIGIFEIEGLYPGYGVTLGNSLRRVLLSSLEGAAVTEMKIKGVQHEFSTIPGVLEDVLTIMLNIKQLRFKIFSSEPQKAVLKVKGEKKVQGSDFNLPPQLELINKDFHIATLTSKSSNLEIEILVEKGLGYRSRQMKKSRERTEVGVIPVDAIFTPVRRVGLKVENMRVGERTDYDRIFIEIETDGTISPEEAFVQAASILAQQFSFLEGKLETKKEEKSVEKKPKKIKSKSLEKNEKKEKRKKTK